MAELDDKLIQNLNQRLQTMETLLSNLTKTLGGVKEGMVSAFNPAIVKSWSDSIKGLKTIRLIDAEKAKTDIKEINDMVRVLTQEQKHGRVFTLFTEEEYNAAIKRLANLRVEIENLNRKAKSKEGLTEEEALVREALRQQRDALYMSTRRGGYLGEMLSPQQMAEVNDQLAKYKALQTDIAKGSERRAAELANLKRNEELNALKQEEQLNKEIAEEEKKRTAEARQRYAEAQAANKAMNKEQDDLEKMQRQSRVAESKSAWRADVQKQVQNEQKMNQAIKQQIQYYRQLHTLYKGYKDLQAKPNKTKEDIAILEQTKQKILEILRLSKQLELENKGSRQAGINATNFQRLSDNLRNATRETKTLKANLNNLLPTIQRLASAFGVAFSVRGLAQFGKKLIETRGEFERQQVALRSILQNKQLADEIWDKTMQAALQSPFTAMQLTTYTKQLAAYRIETDKLFDTTKRLADVSAGLGVDMQRLILAYGQVKAANYLRASEIRQFTEAGVNVLGELRDYFNDIKGMSVDTAQVMEMVTKRLVTFEDVEAIFKRMTDQGGIFYEMQYVQSQTVRGQIAKLHDAYDQMLNSIGRANEGVLKNMVSLLNNIVKNWQEFKTVIDLIAWPLLISFIYKFSRGLMTIATASRLASAGMSKVVIAGAKTKEMFSKLFATIAAHPFIALAAAVAAVGVALLNHAKHVRDINKRYDDLMLRTYETQKNLDGLSDTLQKNLETMKKATKGSEEFNEASRENENIVKKLKDQYPELLQDLDLQKDGYEKLIEKIKQYNDELENQIRLEYAARAGFWQDDLTTNIADLQETQREREMQFLRNREKAEKNYLKLKAKGKEAEEDEWDARIRNAKTWQEQYDILIEFERTQGGRTSGYEWPIGLSAIWGRDVKTRTKDLEKNIENEALVFNDIIRDQLKTINEDLGDDIQQFIKNNESQVNELFKEKEGAGWKLLNKQITKFFTEKGATGKETRQVIQDFLNQYLLVPIQLDWVGAGTSTAATKELADWQKRVNEAIDKATGDFNKKRAELSEDAKKNMPEIEVYKIKDPLKTLEDAQSEILKKLKEVRAKIASYEVKGQVAIDNAEYQALKLTEQEMEQVRVLLGAVAKVTGGGGHKENASKLISIIKEMRSEYDKLSKSAYGYAKSEEKVRDAYKQSYEDILKETGVAANFDFTTNQGEIEALKKVRDYIKGNAKYAKDAWKDVQKTIDQLTAETEIEISVRIREDFGKQMEKAFNDYELTLELDKLNLPKGLAADMWGIEETDLQDLRKRLSQMYMGLRDENGQLSDEAFKDYEKLLNKIDDLERKQQKERLKDYSKYLEAQYSERVKIEMDYVRKLAALEAETAIKEPQKREIREGLKREFLEKSRKQDWEDFKGSEFYVGMMEDLEKQGSASLEVMRNKLLEMRENAENLSPRALKEVVNALEKIDELEKKRVPPLQRLREAQQKLDKEDIENTYKKLAAAQDALSVEEQKQRDLERMIMLEEERQKLEKQGVTLDRAKTNLSMFEGYREVAEGNLRRFKSDGSKESQAQLGALKEDLNKWSMLAEKWADIVRILSGQAVIDAQEGGSKYQGMSIADMRKEYQLAKDRAKVLGEDITKNEELVKWAERLQQAWNDTWESTKKWAQDIQGLFDQVMEHIDYFEDSTLTMTADWKEFGDTTVSAFTDLVEGIQQFQFAWKEMEKTKEGASLAKSLMSGDLIKLAMVVLGVIIKIVQAVAKMNDARIDKEIEQSKERVDDLQKAYERLEKQIEKTFDTVSYMREFNKETQNLYEQIEEANRQIAAAQDYKSADKRKEAIDAAEDAKQQALDALEEIKQAQIEVFGGIGENNYRSAAEGFVDAWKDAFLETGDGLQGLQDHFDEFLQDWFVKQATMRVTQKALEPLFREIDAAVGQYGTGGANVWLSELQKVREKFSVVAPQLANALEELAGSWDLGGEGSLSGLAAGIQGMTEEQANILEAYWNSVRMYTASIDMNVARIAETLGAGGVNTNPQLQQLSLIAANTAATQQLLQSVTKSGHAEGGAGIKVFLN